MLKHCRWWEQKPKTTYGRGTQAALREAFRRMGVERVRHGILHASGHSWTTCFVGAAYPGACTALRDEDTSAPGWDSSAFVQAFALASGLHPMQVRVVAHHFDMDEAGFLQFAAKWVAEQDRAGQVAPVYAEAAV